MNKDTRDYLIGLGMGVRTAMRELDVGDTDNANAELVLRGWKEGRAWLKERSEALLVASERFVPPQPEWDE